MKVVSIFELVMLWSQFQLHLKLCNLIFLCHERKTQFFFRKSDNYDIFFLKLCMMNNNKISTDDECNVVLRE